MGAPVVCFLAFSCKFDSPWVLRMVARLLAVDFHNSSSSGSLPRVQRIMKPALSSLITDLFEMSVVSQCNRIGPHIVKFVFISFN